LGAILIAIYLFCGGKSVEPTSLIKLVEVGALISLGIASFCALASNNLKFKIIWAMYATLEFMFATHLIFRFFKIY
jgi:hypothetical protein